MPTTFDSSHRLLTALALCLGLGLPAIASAKGPSTEDTVAAAKASPLYRRTVKRAQLKKLKLQKVVVSKGVEMDFGRYVRQTALNERPELKPLFDPKLPAGTLAGAPTYVETIYELSDRLVVDRRLTVPLSAGACSAPSRPKAVESLCFTKNPKNKPSKGVSKELAKVRAKLARAPGTKIVKGTVTVDKARKMNDEQLLDLLLNTDERTIHHVSIVPRQPFTPGVKGVDTLSQLDTKLVPATPDSGLMVKMKAATAPKAETNQPVFGSQQTFPTDYFLTGFTYGKEIEDDWEYTFANSTWLTDRYYVRVDYHLGLGLGLRAPFSIAVSSAAASGGVRDVRMSVAPVNVAADGSPAYSAVGLPQNQTFGGKEFVLELEASCRLYVSIPGPNIDRKCPSIDFNKSRDIDPVIGSASSKIHDWWLDGKVTGLGIDAGVAAVTLDLGIGADVTNGKIGMKVAPLSNATFTGLNPGNVTFASTSPIAFQVKRAQGALKGGVLLSDPRYTFDVRFTPKLRAKVDVDVAVYENQWILGPYALDFLSVAPTFELGHHDGTVASHDYDLFSFTGPKGQLPATTATVNEQPSGPTSPPATFPTKGTAKLPGGSAVNKLPN